MYTLENWRKDGSFKAMPGQEISEELYEEMFNVLPPLSLPRNVAENALNELKIPVHAGFMMSEPHDTDPEGRTLFLAFGKNNYGHGDHYFYLGLGHKDKPIKNGVYFYFETIEDLPNDGFERKTAYVTDEKALNFAKDHEASLYKIHYLNGIETQREIMYVPAFQ